MKHAILVAIASIPWAYASAQSFEVASVKAGAPIPIGENFNINLGTVRTGMLTLTNTTLSDCLKFAYELTSDSQIAGPDWIRNKEQRYDVIGKARSDDVTGRNAAHAANAADRAVQNRDASRAA